MEDEINLCDTCEERKKYLDEEDEIKRFYMSLSRAECSNLNQTKARCDSYRPIKER